MSADLALQDAIYAALTTDSTLRSLLASHAFITESPTLPAVYDQPPQAAVPESALRFPYVVIGDETAAEFDTDDINGKEYTITLHVWDRYLGRARVKQILDAIYSALHDARLDVAGHRAIYCYWEFSSFVPDPDNVTKHAATRFRVAVQEA
jgi:hypothetical protein